MTRTIELTPGYSKVLAYMDKGASLEEAYALAGFATLTKKDLEFIQAGNKPVRIELDRNAMSEEAVAFVEACPF